MSPRIPAVYGKRWIADCVTRANILGNTAAHSHHTAGLGRKVSFTAADSGEALQNAGVAIGRVGVEQANGINCGKTALHLRYHVLPAMRTGIVAAVTNKY